MPRLILPRRLLVLACTIGCLCCATLPRQTANTTIEVSGGYARAVHNTFGCNGEVTSTQINQQETGALTVVHERESGLAIGVGAAGMRELVKEVRQYDANPTGRVDWMAGGGAFAGFHGRFVAWEVGGAFTPQLLWPYGALRLGDLSRIWGEARVGALQPLIDPRLFALGGGFRGEMFSIRPWIGFIGRPMHVYNWRANIHTDQDKLAFASNGPDFAGGLEAALSVSEEADVYFHVIAAEAPSAALGLRLRLGGE